MMYDVLIALLPGIALRSYYYGYWPVYQLVIGIVTALCCEYAVCRLKQCDSQPILLDGSAAVTAILLVLCLPPNIPSSLTILGVSISILLGKHVYGGLGHNVFNPAMVGYVVLLVSFPAAMSHWPTIDTGITIDAISGATPLDTFRTQQRMQQSIQVDDFAIMPINLTFALGGFYLLLRRIITWHIPLMLITGVLVTAGCIQWLHPNSYYPLMYHVTTGATLVTACYIATDPVTAPISTSGKLIYAFSIGVLGILIRTYSNFPDGFAFAVLLLNICVPAIDQCTTKQKQRT